MEPERILALDRALEGLEALSPRQARVVECRFFAGLTVEETADQLTQMRLQICQLEMHMEALRRTMEILERSQGPGGT